jgi:hypothetical protein
VLSGLATVITVCSFCFGKSDGPKVSLLVKVNTLPLCDMDLLFRQIVNLAMLHQISQASLAHPHDYRTPKIHQNYL